MRTREQVSFSPLPRRSAQTKIYAGQETAKPNKKGKAAKMNIKTRPHREPPPPQQGYDTSTRDEMAKLDSPPRRTRRLTWWDEKAKMTPEIERQEPLPQQQGYDTSTRDEMAKMDDMDPSLAVADLVRDGAQFAYLQALGDAIDNKEFAVHLAAHGARDGASSSSSSARTIRKRQDQALKRFMERPKWTATTSAAQAAAPKGTDPIAAWNRWQTWNSDYAEAETSDSPTPMDLPAWHSQREEHDSEFTGAGYHTSISSRAASRHWERWNASGKDKAGALTNKQRRKAMRSLRDFHEASGAGEDLYMAFNTFDSSRTRTALKKFASMDKKQLSEDEEEIRATMPKSKVFSKDEFTIVDTGTTVSIEP